MLADIAFRIVSRLVNFIDLTPICASYRAWIRNGVSQPISHVRKPVRMLGQRRNGQVANRADGALYSRTFLKAPLVDPLARLDVGARLALDNDFTFAD
jgi:hypothetical protein